MLSASLSKRVRKYSNSKANTIVIFIAIFFNIGWFSIRFDDMSITAKSRTEAMRIYLDSHDPSYLSTWAVKREYAVTNLDTAIYSGVYKP